MSKPMTPFDATTAAELAASARVDAGGFNGRFFYDGESGDIGYLSRDCDAKRCYCNVKLNADGDQDCSVEIADNLDEHVGPPMVRMLNSHRAIAGQLEAACVEVERLRVFENGMIALRARAQSFGLSPGALLSRFLHVDAKFDDLEAEALSLRSQLAAAQRERNEAMQAVGTCKTELARTDKDLARARKSCDAYAAERDEARSEAQGLREQLAHQPTEHP